MALRSSAVVVPRPPASRQEQRALTLVNNRHVNFLFASGQM